MEETKTRIISLSIPDALLVRLDAQAKKEARTRSNMICRLLKYALTDELKENDND